MLTITRRGLIHGYTASVVSVVCLLPGSRVATISGVGHVRGVSLSVLSNQNGWRWCWFFLGRPLTMPSSASQGGPFTSRRNPALCRRDGPSLRIVRESTRPPGVRTMWSSDVSLLPTQTPLINVASHLCHRLPPCRARCVGLGILTRMTSEKGTTS